MIRHFLIFITVFGLFLLSNSLETHVKSIVSHGSISQPKDGNSLLTAKVFLNSIKYALKKWYPKHFGSDNGKYIDFHGKNEINIRPASMEAFAIGVALKTGIYDEKFIGITKEKAYNDTIRMITSLAYRHLANEAHGWGNVWQSALWAHYTGFGAWLIWDKINVHDKELIEKMIIYESDRFINYSVPYYQNREHKVLHPGDTKAEENAWNSMLLQLSTSMMPQHPHWKLWMHKNIELMISSFVCPYDLTNTTVVNGKAVKDWINGTNVFNNGTLVNHNIIHPDYMTTLSENIQAPLTYALAAMETPIAAFWNDKLMYSALVNLTFHSPPYQKPGGTIYVRDSNGHSTSNIYYPQGNDWGYGRKMNFAFIDTLMSMFSHHGKEFNAEEWAHIHLETNLKMQERFDDGRTYKDHNEDLYMAPEEWVASLAAPSYLARWIKHNNYNIGFTNKNF